MVNIVEKEFKEGYYHGKGVSYYHDVNRIKQYEGEFAYGNFNGTGILYHDTGILYYQFGQTKYYEGTFSYGDKEGEGELYKFDGTKKYKGMFFRNKRHGLGNMINDEGKEYEAVWRNGAYEYETGAHETREYYKMKSPFNLLYKGSIL
jgi:hypothetical protein